MNWSKLWSIIALLGVSTLIFALGYILGSKRYEAQTQPIQVQVRHWNGAEGNPLTAIKRCALFGRSAENEQKQVGTLSFYQGNDFFDILISIDAQPAVFNLADKPIPTPTSMMVYAVEKTLDGSQYIPTKLGVINLITTDKIMSGKFPTTLQGKALASKYERLLFMGPTGASELPPAPQLDFLPPSVKNTPAPYIWSDSLAQAV